jgi:hypothetical protein
VNEVRNLIFLPQMIKNDQICIQTITFEFKQINQELIVHYHPPAPVTGGTAWAVPSSPAPVRAIPLGSGRRYPYRPCSPPHHLQRALPPSRLALPPPGQAVAPLTRTSLMSPTRLTKLLSPYLVLLRIPH